MLLENYLSIVGADKSFCQLYCKSTIPSHIIYRSLIGEFATQVVLHLMKHIAIIGLSKVTGFIVIS